MDQSDGERDWFMRRDVLGLREREKGSRDCVLLWGLYTLIESIIDMFMVKVGWWAQIYIFFGPGPVENAEFLL